MAGKKILMICGDYCEDYETMVPFQTLLAPMTTPIWMDFMVCGGGDPPAGRSPSQWIEPAI